MSIKFLPDIEDLAEGLVWVDHEPLPTVARCFLGII